MYYRDNLVCGHVLSNRLLILGFLYPFPTMEGIAASGGVVEGPWRDDCRNHRSRLSPWLEECIMLEFHENAHGVHEICECRCGRCYQLSWPRQPQNCKCEDWKRGRYLTLKDRIRTRRMRCRCNLAKHVSWGAWFCHRCTEVCEMSATMALVRKREAPESVLTDLEYRMNQRYTTNDTESGTEDIDTESETTYPSKSDSETDYEM
ncbi:hypothetical protein KC19_VG318800 [Ceratodon purpureus]|uniref:Uncharacterized protein n=1 Tax=Ceratodon purpureus TaxID=3225 RepID=A0A8T0HVP4_CERPU|nr:hypothetical protein KC19_VG318800 [Ceratodon purpureus]